MEKEAIALYEKHKKDSVIIGASSYVSAGLTVEEQLVFAAYFMVKMKKILADAANCEDCRPKMPYEPKCLTDPEDFMKALEAHIYDRYIEMKKRKLQ